MLTAEQVRALVAARTRGLRVTAHVQGRRGLEIAIAGGVDELAHMPSRARSRGSCAGSRSGTSRSWRRCGCKPRAAAGGSRTPARSRRQAARSCTAATTASPLPLGLDDASCGCPPGAARQPRRPRGRDVGRRRTDRRRRRPPGARRARRPVRRPRQPASRSRRAEERRARARRRSGAQVLARLSAPRQRCSCFDFPATSAPPARAVDRAPARARPRRPGRPRSCARAPRAASPPLAAGRPCPEA